MGPWTKEVKAARKLRDSKDPVFQIVDKHVTEAQLFAAGCARRSEDKKGYPGLVATKRIYEAVLLAVNKEIEACALEASKPQIIDAMRGWIDVPPGCRDAAERILKRKKVF